MAAPPTWICRSLAIGESLSRLLAASDAVHVVRQAEEEQEEDDEDTDRGGSLVGLAGDRAAPDSLGDGERDVAPVQRKQREQVQERQGERDEREDPEVLAKARFQGLARGLHDPDRARHVLAPLPPEDPARGAADRARGPPR